MLRPYQKEAVSAAMSRNGIIVMPTGSGKSHVIAGLVENFHRALVLQPSREILESNYDKIKDIRSDIAIFSASLKQKQISSITYATIGSIIKKLDLFDIDALIIDECHLVNAAGGQYEKLISALSPKKLIGLTATPYRLHSTSGLSSIRLLNRTRPKIFKDVIHVTQCSDLINQGFLLEPKFIVSDSSRENLLQINSTGAEYTDDSISFYLSQIDIKQRIMDAVASTDAQHILIFLPTIKECNDIARVLPNAASVSSLSSSKERSEILRDFKSGAIRIVLNVGVLTTGFDFPALDCVILARPTMSCGLYSQMVGRCVRPCSNKNTPRVYDLVNNYARFGNPLRNQIVPGSTGLYNIISEFGRINGDVSDIPEKDTVMDFGKYSGFRLCELPNSYLEWFVTNNKKSSTWHMFDAELSRRKFFPAQNVFSG
jgi:DNA repair protein RadD